MVACSEIVGCRGVLYSLIALIKATVVPVSKCAAEIYRLLLNYK